MVAAVVLLLLGSLFVSSVHGSGELNGTMEMDYSTDEMDYSDEMATGMKLKPVNGTFGSHKYQIPTPYVTWVDALTYCAKIGGVLTDVRSREEFVFLQDLCKRSGGRYAYWVGGVSLGKREEFTWISDKSKVGKELWKQGEPKKENGNCVVFKWGEGAPKLAVYDCDVKENRKFICKSPSK